MSGQRLCGARLLVAVSMTMCATGAIAQTFTDPLAPALQTDPRNPPRFQKFSRPALAQPGSPANFTQPASGAGITGFDSTNSRKKAKSKTKIKSLADAQAIAPGLPAPITAWPCQKPPTESADGAYAAASGVPPVELRPIRQPPKKRKAHTEPDDPYAPLGVRTGAFTLFPAVELIGGYNTNPGQISGGSGAAVYSVPPELRVESNWSRHELKADLRGIYTGYSPGETPTR